MDIAQPPAPAVEDGQVIELRQYTLQPGLRDVLIALFDREFVESQEAVGIRVLGQFRDLQDANRFVWLRGFDDMGSRARALQAFYGGSVWAAHRNAANATMVDSDNVLLLRPAWPGAGDAWRPGRAAVGATAAARGRVWAVVLHLQQAANADLLGLCRESVSALLRDAGALRLAWYVTEPAENTFPRLPVREGEQVVLGMALFDDEAAHRRFVDSGVWEHRAVPSLSTWFAMPPQVLALAPTARSAIHA